MSRRLVLARAHEPGCPFDGGAPMVASAAVAAAARDAFDAPTPAALDLVAAPGGGALMDAP